MSEPTVDHLPAGDHADAGSSVLEALADSLAEIPHVRLREPDSEDSTSAEIPGGTARLRLAGEIARGGMGAVLKGRDTDLGRDIAVKVLLEEHRGAAELVHRFVEEAQIAGQLQHPGVVPVYELGAFPDRRPYFTMKLVKGQTLAALLAARQDVAEDRPRFVGVFAQVCQTLAYAHARGVIHRDLKPANIMVGAFGEVLVMDWGLAKVLQEADTADEGRTQQVSVIRTTRSQDSDTPESGSPTQAGTLLGTPSYLAPEQARGDVALVDKRADVFGLGAMLCEILTGKPPFTGKGAEATRKAQTAQLDDAHARLDGCGADAELVALARRCLAAEPWGRPRHAGEIADAVTSYQQSVAERLHQAELARAAEQARAQQAQATATQERRAKEEAEARAQAERRARRLTMALAAAALLLVLGGGGGAWWMRQRRQMADAAVVMALGEARLLLGQAKDAPLAEAAKYREALAAARQADELASTGGASEELRQQATELAAEVVGEAEAAERDRRLLARLLDVRGPREGPKYRRDDQGMMMALAEPTADEQFASAFRDWGLDVDTTAMSEARTRLKARPAAVVLEVAAALDEWASQRRADKKSEAEWRRPAELAAALEEESDSPRQELRAILVRGRLPVERAMDVLSVALRLVPVPLEVPLGPDRARLRQLAVRADLAREPVLGVLTLARALRLAGEDTLAERLLRAASAARPGEVVLYHALGQLLAGQEPPRWAEAVECYRAARALRTDLGVNLATALLKSGREREGLEVLAWLVKERPDNPNLHFQQAYALSDKHDLDGAISCYKKALELDPKNAKVHSNLGIALAGKGDLDGAIACFKNALALDPKYAAVHSNLGVALSDKHDLDGAIACCKKALELDPKYAPAHSNLGIALYKKHDLSGAIACWRKAIALDPKYAQPHSNLGVALHSKGDLSGAIACHQKAIELDPKYAPAHSNLGNALHSKGDLGGAIACYRKALELDPKNAPAQGALGLALLQQGRFAEARRWTHSALHLLPPSHPQHRLAAAQLRQCEALLAADEKLPAVLQGKASPTNPGEAISLAQMCQRHKQRHAAAARLYADAFAAEPKLAADLKAQYRYAAACSAALAAAGQGGDARLLPDKVAGMFRRWALDWLRADLAAYAKLLENDKQKNRELVQQSLQHWQKDSDLAGLRDKDAVAKLPTDQQEACKKLWFDVDALLQKAR
jgi:eukaryotic-like serine/threonine-protein kinase